MAAPDVALLMEQSQCLDCLLPGQLDYIEASLLNDFVSFLMGSEGMGMVSCEGCVDLGTAQTYGILAGSMITNTGSTVINGDLGLSPGSSVTGFPPGTVNGTQHIADAEALQAQTDLIIAYDFAAGQTDPAPIVVAGNIGGQTLTPGIYKSTSSLAISSGDLTLAAQGDPNACWIFQIASTLDVASGRKVILTGGAQAKNVFWQVGTSATLGTNSFFKGTIMALTSITATTGAAVEGRLLARNGATTLDTNSIDSPPCS